MMDKKSNSNTVSSFQFMATMMIGIFFIALMWRIIPLDNLFKSFLLCIFGLPILAVVHTFIIELEENPNLSSHISKSVLTAVIFLFVPFLVNIEYDIHKDTYLHNIPPDQIIALKITVDVEPLGGSGSIGNEWSYIHLFNDEQFKSGDTIEIGYNTPFSITSRFIEHDSISDIGEKSSQKYLYSKNDIYKKDLIFSQEVHVAEHGGRHNAGAHADFNATYTLKRVLPKSVSFLQIFLTTNSKFEKNFCYGLIICGFLCASAIIYITIRSAIRVHKQESQKSLENKKQPDKKRKVVQTILFENDDPSIYRNKIILTIFEFVLVFGLVIYFLSKSSMNNEIYFHYYTNDNTGEQSGLLISLFLYALFGAFIGLIPCCSVIILTSLLYLFIHRKDKNLLNPRYSPDYGVEMEYGVKLAVILTYSAVFLLITLQISNLVEVYWSI